MAAHGSNSAETFSSTPAMSDTSDDKCHEHALHYEDSIYRLVTRRLMPVLLIVFCIAYMDRINIGLAKLHMSADLGFSDTVYGIGVAMFYASYAILGVPSNIIMHKLGARRWIARIAVSWGIVSMCMMFVQTPIQFYILRLLLGAAECGLFPGIILYLTYWYPAHRRARMVAIFMAALPLAGMIAGPLSGWIMDGMAGVYNLYGWQWMFLIEALPAVIMGIVIFYVLPDGVKQAHWLEQKQKSYISHLIRKEDADKPATNIKEALKNPRLWLMCLMMFSFATGNMGISFWLPSIIQHAAPDASAMKVGTLTSIPYAFSAVAMVLLSCSSDRLRERRWHLAIPSFLAAVLLTLTVLYQGNLWLIIILMTLASMCIFAVAPLFWSQPTALLSGYAAAAGIGVISMFANFAGLFSPALFGYLSSIMHSPSAGIFLLAGFMLFGGAIALTSPAHLVNK